MLLRGAMPEIGLEIESEVGCVGDCGGCTVAVPEGVRRVCVRRVCGGCVEVVRRVCVRRLCRGCAEVSVDGEMSTCPMSENVWWLSCHNVVSLRPDLQKDAEWNNPAIINHLAIGKSV